MLKAKPLPYSQITCTVGKVFLSTSVWDYIHLFFSSGQPPCASAEKRCHTTMLRLEDGASSGDMWTTCLAKKGSWSLTHIQLCVFPVQMVIFSLCAHFTFKSNPHHGLHVADCQRKQRNTEPLLQWCVGLLITSLTQALLALFPILAKRSTLDGVQSRHSDLVMLL